MGILRGIICDGTSGALVEAKVHVLSSNGQFIHPSDSLLKIGPGDPFFIVPGDFPSTFRAVLRISSLNEEQSINHFDMWCQCHRRAQWKLSSTLNGG